MRLALVILAVGDVTRSRDFYVRALGWRVQVEVPVYVELQGTDGMRLGLYERTAFTANTAAPVHVPVPAGAVAATELYFFSDDPHAAVDRLRDAGARPLTELTDRAWGDEAAYFADPDGNVVVVARPLPA